MKADDEGVTDLTQEAGLEEANDSELFANLGSRAPAASGLHRRPREALAQVARLGAMVPSAAPGRSLPPPPSGPAPAGAAALARSVPPRLSTAAPAAKPAVSTIQSGAFDEDEPTPGRQILPGQRRGGSRAKVAIAVGAAALVLFVVVLVAARSIGRSGSLIVTATGPGSSEVTGIEVLVDGEKLCAVSPCKLASIAPGTHLVSVRAKGFNSTAPLAVTVSAQNESVLNVALAPAAIPPAAPPKPAAPSPAPEQAATSKQAESRSTPALPNTRAAPATAPTGVAQRNAPTATQAAAPASGAAADDKAAFGTLRIVSLPVASILVDGRPVGRTPQVLRVAPGQHRVAIVAGEDRRAQTVTVAPGATQVVSVRF